MTRNWQKIIRQLQQKKFRKKEELFIVEGAKSVQELLDSDLSIEALFCTAEFAQQTPTLANRPFTETDAATLAKAGSFKTNDGALAVAMIPENKPLFPDKDFILALDDVRDPGNLGTIIRIADWYGMQGVVCTNNCADIYNPKAIAATMGSFTRIPTYYCDLPEYLSEQSKQTSIYGAFMNGNNLHQMQFEQSGIIVLGNESNGISEACANAIAHPITIPRFGKAESLNVAMAGAIICDNVRQKA